MSFQQENPRVTLFTVLNFNTAYVNVTFYKSNSKQKNSKGQTLTGGMYFEQKPAKTELFSIT